MYRKTDIHQSIRDRKQRQQRDSEKTTKKNRFSKISVPTCISELEAKKLTVTDIRKE